MVLLPRILSAADRVAQHATANPKFAAIFENGLDDVHHVRYLTQPTIDCHDNIKGKWRDFTDYHPKRKDLPAEIVLGAELPSLGIAKEFISYLAIAVRGTIKDIAARRTVTHHMYTWLACWRRYADQDVPKQYRYQIGEFLNSTDFQDHLRPPLDLDRLVRFALEDSTFFRTARAAIQFNGVNILGAMSGERPGAIIESSRYRGSNQGIQWRDIRFIVVPNPEDPYHPYLAVAILFRYLKGHRDDPAHYKTLFALLRPLGYRAECIVTILLYLALRDNVFDDGVDTAGQIISPRNPPSAKYELRIKDEAKFLSVFRRDEYNPDDGWVTSPTKALSATTHNANLRKVCALLGYMLSITMYAWRRAAAGVFDKYLKNTERDALLNHGPDSHMFVTAYQDRTLVHDVAGLLWGRQQDTARIELAESANSMSWHEGAPTRLTIQQRGKLLNEPELVVMRSTLQGYKDEVAKAKTELKSIDPDEPEADETFASLQGVLRSSRRKHDELRSKYDAIINRETRARIKAARDEFFEGVAGRQTARRGGFPRLDAPAPPARTLTREPLADTTRNSVVVPQSRVLVGGKENVGMETSFLADIEAIDPNVRLNDVLYRFAELNLAAETEASVNAYLGYPERRRAAICYQGESPTEDEKCPVCKRDCSSHAFRNSGSQTVGSHIHGCIMKARQQGFQKLVEDEFTTARCEWVGCAEENEKFTTREEFVAHVQAHIITLSRPPTSVITRRLCQWALSGAPCEEEDSDSWEHHFAQVHGLNICHSIQVFFCAICPEWHVDLYGDGLAWRDHLWEHHDTLFALFCVRPDHEVDLTPIGIVENEEKTLVGYTLGTGFSGAHPELYGDVRCGVADPPAHCAWCVFNTALPIEIRMHQFLRTADFVKHLEHHAAEVEEVEEPQECPVPSCGPTKFTARNLLEHMVKFHRLPIYGATNHTKTGRYLKLAPPPPAPAPAVDFTHTTDIDIDTAPVTWKAAKKVTKVQRKAEKAAIVRGHCLGCFMPKADIGKHIANNAKCRSKNSYNAYGADGERIREVLRWNLVDVPLPGADNARKLHKCNGPCQRQYSDIRDHLQNPGTCRPRTFYILTPRPPNPRKKTGDKKKRPKTAAERTAELGKPIDIAEWVAAQKDNAPVQDNEEFVQGSSKRSREAQEDSDTENEAGLSKRSHLSPSPDPGPPQFMCNGCNSKFNDLHQLSGHFATLRHRSKCRAKILRVRNPESTSATQVWLPAIEWATWEGNPDNAVVGGEE
ncbi:hypothetical protein R3P38DRAFT_3564752 [Favolaschia claudopus]|uniref:C2H2-type domain-containing protein n=1 Tax=Favolaschia claudopus TaxID=2862362 RepID=A0AAW0DU13_9AGAR